MLEAPSFKASLLAFTILQALKDEAPSDAIFALARGLGHAILYFSSEGYISEQQLAELQGEINEEIEKFVKGQYLKWRDVLMN